MTVPAPRDPRNARPGVSREPHPICADITDEIGRRVVAASHADISATALGLYAAALGKLGVSRLDWLAEASAPLLAELAGFPSRQAARFVIAELVNAGLLIRAGRIMVDTPNGRRQMRRYMLAPVAAR